MTQKLYTESYIENIADAIRDQNGSSDEYFVSEMASAISALPTTRVIPNDLSFGYSTVTSFPNEWEWAPRSSCTGLFYSCSNLTTAPTLDTTQCQYFGNMFNGCVSLATVPNLDTSAGIAFGSMFYQCSSLTSVPNLDTSHAVTMASMFYGCSSLTEIPALNTPVCTGFNQLCYGCTNLTTIPVFNMSALATGMSLLSNMFYNCTSLSNTSLQNILKSLLTIPDAYYSGFIKTTDLKDVGLTRAQATTCTGFSEWSTLTSKGWATGY